MLSRGVLNGAAINALAVNGDGIVHSASGTALMGISGLAETVRRTVAAGIDVFRMVDSLTLTPRRNAKAASLLDISSDAPFVVWLSGSSDSSINLDAEAKGSVWKVGFGIDAIQIKAFSDLAIRITIGAKNSTSLAGAAFGTHRHGVHASDAINLLGSGYANTYGAIKGTGSVGLKDQTDFVRVVSGRINDVVELNNMVAATAWYSAGGYGVMAINAAVQAVRWLPSDGASVASMNAVVQAARTLAPTAIGVWNMQYVANATRWSAARSTAIVTQTGETGVLVRKSAVASSAVNLSAKVNPALRQPISSTSLFSFIGLMPLPHVYMQPIDDCRTLNIRYEPREISVPEERNSMSYRCCGGTK